MIYPKAFARVIENAALIRAARPQATGKARKTATILQINRTPWAREQKITLTQINPLSVITPAGRATAEPVITWPEINQSGQTRQLNIIATSRTLTTRSTAIIRQVFEPFSYIRIIPPPPAAGGDIDGGQFDDSHSRRLDGGQFGEESQPVTDAGGF